MTSIPKRWTINEICKEIVIHQRQRTVTLKSVNMIFNRLLAVVACDMGYHTGMESEAERKKMFDAAKKVIKQVEEGKVTNSMSDTILTTLASIKSLEPFLKGIETAMEDLAKALPVAAWVQKRPQQRGFGLLFLAIVIGETGNLNNYANPAKVWRRMGCAPHSFDGHTLMGSTWAKPCKDHPALPASEWEQFGYSPRRRSIAYLIGENIVKQNKSIYRKRYEDAKKKIQKAHPDYSKKRCHLHGMLLGTKLFLKNLWREWTGKGVEWTGK